jgi:hypothetical protein
MQYKVFFHVFKDLNYQYLDKLNYYKLFIDDKETESYEVDLVDTLIVNNKKILSLKIHNILNRGKKNEDGIFDNFADKINGGIDNDIILIQNMNDKNMNQEYNSYVCDSKYQLIHNVFVLFLTNENYVKYKKEIMNRI